MDRKSRAGSRKLQYHIVQQEARWWVENDEGICVHASPDQQEAVTWAIRAAQHDHAHGLNVIVCIEQPGGFWKTAWHS
jgi:hypothetical protein